jgi:hypothetical protein
MTLRFPRSVIGLLVVSGGACNSAELSPSSAAAAISDRLGGPAGSIRIFRTRCVERNFVHYPLAFIEDIRVAAQYESLEDAGLVTMFLRQATQAEATECGTPYLEHKELIGIALTAKGAEEKWPEHTERAGGWDVVLGRRELIEVTSVQRESDAMTARADFTWRLVPTTGGAALGQTSSPLRGSATFERVDDAWRLVRIEY